VLVSGGDMLGRPFVARLLADGEAGPGILGIADRVVGVSEQNGHATVTVQRLGGSHGAVSVAYLTSDENSGSTATPGSDFTAVSGRLDWADGDVSDKPITIPIVADSSSFESDETFTLRLRDPQGGAGLGTEKTDIVIRGDGYVGGVFTTQATATSVQENDSTVRFIVHRNVGSQGAVSVTATVTGVSATAGVDFTAPTPVTLAWADGDATDKFVDVRILDDHKHEDAERFTFALSNATGGAVINATPLSVTIVDEDQKGGGAFGAFGALLLGLAGAVRARRRRG
jgi:MYXO-CTERM domain-containing protein